MKYLLWCRDYLWVVLLVIGPVALAYHYSAVLDAQRDGVQIGRNAVIAEKALLRDSLETEKEIGKRVSDSLTQEVRDAEAQTLAATSKATTASTRLRRALAQLPDTVRDTTIVEVERASESLIAAVDTLRTAVDSLVSVNAAMTRAYAAERLVWRASDDAQRYALAAVNHELAKAQRRPTRKEQFLTAAISACLGYGISEWRNR